MDPRSPLALLQIARLRALAELGVCKDESLAAYMRELGQPCDRSAIAGYRTGRRAAPLALLDVVLDHVEAERRPEILGLWATPLGLEVTPAELAGSGTVADRVLEIADLAGQLAAAARLQTDEPERIAAIAGPLRRCAAGLERLDGASLRRAA